MNDDEARKKSRPKPHQDPDDNDPTVGKADLLQFFKVWLQLHPEVRNISMLALYSGLNSANQIYRVINSRYYMELPLVRRVLRYMGISSETNRPLYDALISVMSNQVTEERKADDVVLLKQHIASLSRESQKGCAQEK